MPTPLPEQPEEDEYRGAGFNEEVRRSQLWQLDWKLLGFKYCGVYAISQARSGWPIKIGISARVQGRLAGLQVAQWNQLDVFHYWICENAIAARKVEKAAHDFLIRDDKRMSGEWFDIREYEVPAIIEFVAENAGVEIVKELPSTPKFAEAHKRLEQISARYTAQFERAIKQNTERRADYPDEDGWPT